MEKPICNGCGKEIAKEELPIPDMVKGYWHRHCSFEASYNQSEARRLTRKY